MVSEVIYIVIEAPIRALVNTDTLEVHIELDEKYRFFEPTILKHDGIEYISIDEISGAVKDLHDSCPDDCCDDSAFMDMLEEMRNEILKAVSM